MSYPPPCQSWIDLHHLSRERIAPATSNQFAGRHRSAKQPALGIPDTSIPQVGRLLFAFNAFGNHREVAIPCHGDDVVDDMPGDAITADRRYERLVYLQISGSKGSEIGQTGVPDAEVVNSDRNIY